MLTDEHGVVYEVKFAEDTMISEEIQPVEAEETEEIVSEETAAEEVSEEIESKEETISETAEEPAEETEADETALEDAALVEDIQLPSAELLSESAIEWTEGDVVTVYYNGMMSRSIPAQITALEIVIIR